MICSRIGDSEKFLNASHFAKKHIYAGTRSESVQYSQNDIRKDGGMQSFYLTPTKRLAVGPSRTDKRQKRCATNLSLFDMVLKLNQVRTPVPIPAS
jgi:hypothetical protein